MGTQIQASELAVGDLYREYRSGSRLSPGGAIIRKVTARRTVRFMETYEVLETLDIEGRGLRGEISLRTDTSVERLDELAPRNVYDDVLCNLVTGEQLNIVYDGDGRFWA